MTSSTHPDEQENVPEVDSISRYFHSMEERIKTLEARIGTLTGQNVSYGDKNSSLSQSSRGKTSLSAIPGILSLDRTSFQSPDREQDSIYAIELLIDENVITMVRIRSEQLLHVFQEVMGLDLAPDPSQSVIMVRPFKALMIYREDFEKARAALIQETATDPEEDENSVGQRDVVEASTKHYLDLLSACLNNSLHNHYIAYSSLRDRSAESVSFLHLCYLFQPGDMVVEGSGTSIQAFQVRSMRVRSLPSGITQSSSEINGSAFELNCFYVGYDGKSLGPVQTIFTIMHFHGTRVIDSLPIAPIEYLDKEDTMFMLIRRGRQFLSHVQIPGLHRGYSGLSLDEIPQQIEGEVIIDLELYYRQNHSDAPAIGVSELANGLQKDSPVYHDTFNYNEISNVAGVYDDSKVDKRHTQIFFEDHPEFLQISEGNRGRVRLGDTLVHCQIRLLPRLIWAFSLRGRKWHLIDIAKTSEILWPEDVFDNLVLVDENKRLLIHLVQNHISRVQNSSNIFIDPLRKGKGLFILLHGAPGLGKTSTAECLAAHFRRPLFPITAADIGDTAAEVQQHLDTYFTLAHRWGCILLFEEADIILQRRDRNDIKRNTIVSVFLRVFEYYSGILIFTTNRVGTFDEALNSRIHIVLYFPPLNRTASRKILEIALQQAREEKLREGKAIIIDESAFEFVVDFWNKRVGKQPSGRTIYNTVQSAVALAEESQGKELILSWRHLKVILEISEQFEEYLTATHGGTENVQARRYGDRNDDFGETPKYISRASRNEYRTDALAGLQAGQPPRILTPPSQGILSPLQPPSSYTTSRESEKLRRKINELDQTADISDSDSDSAKGSSNYPAP